MRDRERKRVKEKPTSKKSGNELKVGHQESNQGHQLCRQTLDPLNGHHHSRPTKAEYEA